MNKFLLFLLFVLSPLLASKDIASIVVLCEIILLIIIGTKLKTFNLKSTNKFFLLSFVWMFICGLVCIELDSAIRIFQFAGCYFSLKVASSLHWRNNDFLFIRKIIIILIFCALIHTLLSRTFSHNQFVFLNSNVCAVTFYCWIVLLTFIDKSLSIYTILLLFLIYTTTARADFFCALFFFILIFLFVKNKYIKEKTITLFWIEIILMVVFVIIYPTLLEYDIGQAINEESQIYTGKELMSGRNRIWVLIFESALNSPVYGYGLAAIPESLYQISISSHNTFLQILMQQGFVGLGLFLLLIWTIIKELNIRNTNINVVISISFLFTLIIHECFEVCLTQNLMFIGLMFWFFIGIGLNGINEPIQNTHKYSHNHNVVTK